MVVLAIVWVAPAHPAATMQWARLWGHVGAHNEFFPKGCQNSTSRPPELSKERGGKGGGESSSKSPNKKNISLVQYKAEKRKNIYFLILKKILEQKMQLRKGRGGREVGKEGWVFAWKGQIWGHVSE